MGNLREKKVRLPKVVTQEQIDFLSKFDDNTAWTCKFKTQKKKYDMFIVLDESKTYVKAFDVNRKPFKNFGQLVLRDCSLENFIEQRCIETSLTFEKWSDKILNPRVKRKRKTAFKIEL